MEEEIYMNENNDVSPQVKELISLIPFMRITKPQKEGVEKVIFHGPANRFSFEAEWRRWNKAEGIQIKLLGKAQGLTRCSEYDLGKLCEAIKKQASQVGVASALDLCTTLANEIESEEDTWTNYYE